MKNKYSVKGDYVEIYVVRMDGSKHTILIDTEDLQKVHYDYPNSWTVKKIKNNFYVNGQKDKEHFLIHRYLMNPPKGMMVDHINHNTLDNRRNNLRIVTNAQNMQNLKGAHKDSSTGVRNVSWDKSRNKYMVTVYKDGVNHHGGRYECKGEAEKAAILKRKELGFLNNKTKDAVTRLERNEA